MPGMVAEVSTRTETGLLEKFRNAILAPQTSAVAYWLAFGATATGGIFSSCVCALSYERINDFDRIRHAVLGQ